MNLHLLLQMLKSFGHAVLAAVVVAAAWLMSVLPHDASLGDVTFVQWLGAIVAVGGAFGITQSARRTPPED